MYICTRGVSDCTTETNNNGSGKVPNGHLRDMFYESLPSNAFNHLFTILASPLAVGMVHLPYIAHGSLIATKAL
jgi:hypothetical protein